MTDQEKPETGLPPETQIVETLDFLWDRDRTHISAERLHMFFRQESLSPQTLFTQLASFGQSCGLVLNVRRLTQSELLEHREIKAIGRRGDELLAITAVDPKSQLLSVRSFKTGQTETVSVDSLYGASKHLELLFCDGTLHSFMTTEANLAPLRQPIHLEDASKHSGNGHAGHGTDSHDQTDNILSKLFRLLREERRDLGVVLAYSIIIGLLSLVIPLSSQAIVNAVALGVFSNQLIVLCGVVAFGVITLSGFSLMEKFVVDVLQRRIFVRTAFEIAYRLPRIKQSSLAGEYAPELVNRFFDVLTVQKTIGKFLLDGVSATLVALIGLLLLAVYHPFFILLDILLLLFAPFIVFVLGRGGLKTSIKESKKKYALAHWLEDIARCQTSFKLSSTPEFIFERVDHIATEYVKARASHFRVLAWQLAGSAAIRVFATVGVLGIGGSLVISGQLSLGQLVAAELVVLSLMSALEKLVTQFEEHYDLLTAIDKISHITDKPLEPVGGEVLPETNAAASLRLREVSFEYPNGHKVLNHLSLDVSAGGRVSLVGESGAGKSTLTTLLVGLYEPTHGLIEISGRDLSRMDLRSLRKAVGVVLSNNEIFEGTLEENITLGRELGYDEVQWALRTAQIYDEVLSLPQGLQTHLVSAGNNVPDGLLRRIMFARAIAGKPRILVLDEAFSGIEESSRLKLIESLYAEKCWTIIDISHDAELTRRAETVFVLERGHIAEQGSPRELSTKSDSGFVRLFPGLVKQFHESEAARSLADQSIELRLPGGSNGSK